MPSKRKEPLEKEGSRISGIRADGGEPPRPIAFLEYLLEVFYEIGPTGYGAAGPIPLTDADLLAWQQNHGIRLQPWEVRAVIRLSKQWIDWAHRGRDPACASPWPEYVDPPEVTRVRAERMRETFGRMAK